MKPPFADWRCDTVPFKRRNEIRQKEKTKEKKTKGKEKTKGQKEKTKKKNPVRLVNDSALHL